MTPPTWLHWPAAGGSTPWAPTDLASLYAWYQADAITGLSNGDPVSTWADSSGNGYDLTASGADRPSYQTNTLNSLAVVDFNATHWLAASTAADWKFLHDSTGSSVFMVLRYTRQDRMAFLWTSPFNSTKVGWTFCADSVNTVYNLIRGSGSWTSLNKGANDVSVNTDYVMSVVCDPSNGTAADRSAYRIDGGTAVTNNVQSGTPSTADPNSPLTLGRVGDSNMDGLEGYIAEVVICNAALSDPDRQDVEGYLAHKWGLEGNLPAGHDHKNSPP